MSQVAKRWCLLIVLLVAETECLVVPNYEIRTAIRELFHFPVYYLMLGFLGFSLVLRFLVSDQLPPLPAYRLSRAFLSCHLSLFVSLIFLLLPLYRLSVDLPIEAATGLWLFVVLAYGGTWLGTLIPPSQWSVCFRLHLPWMLTALFLSVVARVVTMASTLLWKPMAGATFTVTIAILELFFPDASGSPQDFTLGTTNFDIKIDPGCSGYEGMGLIVLFILIFFWVRRRELLFPQAFLLLPLGIGIQWFSNALRIAALVAVGTCISPYIALKGFHSQAGWIAFTLISIGLVLVAEKMEWFHSRAESSEVRDYPAACLMVPLLVLLLARMITMAFTVTFDLYYPLRIIVLVMVLWAFRKSYRVVLTGGASAYSVIVGLVVYVIWAALVPGQEAKGVTSVLTPPWSGLWLVFRIVGSVVVIPLVEELAFRGYLLRRLQKAHFEEVPVGSLTLASLALSSLAFGLLHGEWLAGTVAGLAYGYSVKHRGRLMDAVVAHGVTNLCIAVQVMALGHWSLWS